MNNACLFVLDRRLGMDPNEFIERYLQPALKKLDADGAGVRWSIKLQAQQQSAKV